MHAKYDRPSTMAAAAVRSRRGGRPRRRSSTRATSASCCSGVRSPTPTPSWRASRSTAPRASPTSSPPTSRRRTLRLERFDFDAELRGVQRACFAPAERAVDAAVDALFGKRYVAALRRDGYEGPRGSGLGYYSGRRHGFAVAPDVLPIGRRRRRRARRQRRRHGARRVLLATNSRDANELAELRERVEYSRVLRRPRSARRPSSSPLPSCCSARAPPPSSARCRRRSRRPSWRSATSAAS